MDFLSTGREVLENEISGLQDLLNSLGEEFKKACSAITGCSGHIIVTGMGKSGHIGQKISATLSSTGTPSFFLHPAEASHGDLGVITNSNLVIAISNSGESKELFDILEFCKRNGITLIGITARSSSTLGKYSDILLQYPLEKEACKLNLAPTTSTTISLALGDALAVAVYMNKNFTKEDFSKFHPGGKLGKQLIKVKDILRPMDQIAVVDIQSTVKDALLEMSGKLGGCALVLDENHKLLGVVTDGDVRRYLTGFDAQDVLSHAIKNVMSVQPHTTDEDTLAADAIHFMNSTRITSVPVLRNDVVIGLLHIHDLVNLGF